jgi:hypothetical protein
MTSTAPDASARSGALGLTGICLGFLLITLDVTIVNVALGPIGADFGGALSTAQWIVNGYTLTFAALLLSAGALADRAGSRTGFLVGLAIFALGSAACAGATSLTVLIVARVVQAAGAATLMPCSLALIVHGFPEAHERRRALGLWGGASGIGLAAGPVLGGVLIAAFGWRAIFLVNVPVAAAAALLLVRHVDETRRHRHPLDVPGSTARDRRPGLADRRVHHHRRPGLGRDAHARAAGRRHRHRRRVRGRGTSGRPPDGRSAALPRAHVLDRGRDRVRVQLLPLRSHLLPGDRPTPRAGARSGAHRAGPAADHARHGDVRGADAERLGYARRRDQSGLGRLHGLGQATGGAGTDQGAARARAPGAWSNRARSSTPCSPSPAGGTPRSAAACRSPVRAR